MIAINEHPHLLSLLAQLDEKRNPLFGILTPQHMIEHLQMVVSVSNGRTIMECRLPPEKVDFIKATYLTSENEMPKGVKFPGSKDTLPELQHANIPTAIRALMQEILAFHDHFRAHPDHKPVHPYFGSLDYQEWMRLHNKHFVHHFKQFELL